MIRFGWWWGAAMTALAGSVAAAEFDPYEISKAQFTERVRVIALAPARVPPEAADPAAARDAIEARVTELLRLKGYEVVPARVYAALWQRMSERLGGTFDPITGNAREDAFEAARDHVGRELERLHRADAVLHPFVTFDWAPFTRMGDHYQACGEILHWQGQPIVNALINHPQQVRAAYLGIVIADLAGTKLYGVRAPAQWVAIYAARGYEERPAAEQLATWALSNAVDRDLAYLVPAAGAAP